jgi:hypothetical protein
MANQNYPVQPSTKVAPVWQTVHALADEGSYFVATNPTPGTGIATTTSVVDGANSGATSAQTRPLMIVYNGASPNDPNAKNLYPLYLNMSFTTVPAVGTVWQTAMWLEPVGASAYTSGGSTIVPNNVNPNSNTNTRASVYFGALTAAATTTGGKLVMARAVTSILPILRDVHLFTFGDVTQPAAVIQGTATVARTIVVPCAPLVIPPGYALKLGGWMTGNNAAPAWEFEFGYAERAGGL